MGLYDTVIVPCPQCSTNYYVQSKGGECLMREFNLDNAPDDVMSDINRHAPFVCKNCGVSFEVPYHILPVVEVVRKRG